MVAKSVNWWTGNFWWNVQTWNPNNNSVPYSMWIDSKKIDFSKIMVARYSWNKNIELAITIDADDNVRKNDTTTEILTNDTCKVVYNDWILDSEISWNHCQMFKRWWYITDTDKYYFRDVDWDDYWLLNNAFNTSTYDNVRWAFHWKQWMIFVR